MTSSTTPSTGTTKSMITQALCQAMGNTVNDMKHRGSVCEYARRMTVLHYHCDCVAQVRKVPTHE
eukprot:5624644-Amphidinium_carterae.1